MTHTLNPSGITVKDDLSKAEQKWAKKRLFAPPPRRRAGWVLLLIASLAFGLLLYQMADGAVFIPF